MRHTISVLVENQPGVLMRVAALFGRRAYNIESLAVGVTENPRFSRMTVVAHGDDAIIEQITKQLDKLINIVRVLDLTSVDSVRRELALVRVQAKPSERASILQIADIFRARVVDMSKNSMVIELTGDEDKVDAMLSLLWDFGVLEVVRTGQIAMSRGNRTQDQENQFAEGDERDGEGLLRSRCRPEFPYGQDRGSNRLR